MEIQNLARFISVMKFWSLVWRNTYLIVVADYVEYLTDPELIHQNSRCNRTVTLYGYLRATNLKSSLRIYIPGAGDHTLADVSVLPDPCALTDKGRTPLDEKHKLIHAPMSDGGGVMYDKDTVYIYVPDNFLQNHHHWDLRNGNKTINMAATIKKCPKKELPLLARVNVWIIIHLNVDAH